MNWQTFGQSRAPELRWVLLFAWWRSAAECPYVLVQLRGMYWEVSGFDGKIAVQQDDRWCSIPGGAR